MWEVVRRTKESIINKIGCLLWKMLGSERGKEMVEGQVEGMVGASQKKRGSEGDFLEREVGRNRKGGKKGGKERGREIGRSEVNRDEEIKREKEKKRKGERERGKLKKGRKRKRGGGRGMY